MLEALYTGAYTDKQAEQRIDYTEYLFIGQYLPYYICDYSVYSGLAPTGTCQAPNLYGDIESNLRVETHELRFNTPAEKRLRATFGGFYSDLTLDERVDFSYPGNKYVRYASYVGFPNNFRFPGPGYSSDDGAFPADTIFRNDTRRTDKQLGVFGEATFELSDQFAITAGLAGMTLKSIFKGRPTHPSVTCSHVRTGTHSVRTLMTCMTGMVFIRSHGPVPEQTQPFADHIRSMTAWLIYRRLLARHKVSACLTNCVRRMSPKPKAQSSSLRVHGHQMRTCCSTAHIRKVSVRVF